MDNESRDIVVTNIRDRMEVFAFWTDDKGTDHETWFVALDKNEWTWECGEIPAEALAVLNQIYLHHRNLAPPKWIRETNYMIYADDKMFEPLWAWLEGVE